MGRIIEQGMRTHSLHVSDSVRSLFAMELLLPGPVLYLAPARMWNTVILPNRGNQFGAIAAEPEAEDLTLDIVLSLLVEKGVDVRILYNQREGITNRLPLAQKAGAKVRFASPGSPFGIVGSHLSLRGGMRFSNEGVTLESAEVHVESDTVQIQRALLRFDAIWEEASVLEFSEDQAP